MQDGDKAFVLGKLVTTLVLNNTAIVVEADNNIQDEAIETSFEYAVKLARFFDIEENLQGIRKSNISTKSLEIWRKQIRTALFSATQSSWAVNCFEFGVELALYCAIKGGYPLNNEVTKDTADRYEQKLRNLAKLVGPSSILIVKVVEAAKNSSISLEEFIEVAGNTFVEIKNYLENEDNEVNSLLKPISIAQETVKRVIREGKAKTNLTVPKLHERHAILLIHGIRTQGFWQEMVRDCLEYEGEDSTVTVFPIGYGYFDIIKFWSPFFTRQAPIERIKEEIRHLKAKYPDSHLSIIAHSFGTFAVGQILQLNPEIKLRRLILCGAILPQGFHWNRVSDQIEELYVLNDCGTNDIWPVLAKATSWGYGATGTFGFKTINVRDRFHNYKHSDYFSQDFVLKYWKPYILFGKIEKSEWDVKKPTPPWWLSLVSILPLNFLIVFLLILLLLTPFIIFR